MPIGIINPKIEGDILVPKLKMIFSYNLSHSYDVEVGRFLNVNEDLHTYNPYVYCGNNPVGRIDATGLSWDDITNWFNDRWNEVSTWASNTFSGAVYASNSYEGLQLTTLYGGIESGISTLRIIAGDNEKSVVFFVQNASEWWKIW